MIIQSTEDGIMGLSLDGTIISWNPAAERLFGYTSDEVMGQSKALLIPDDRKHELNFLLESIKSGNPIERFETKRKCKNGSLIDVSAAIPG